MLQLLKNYSACTFMNINTWKRLERIGNVASVGSTKTDTEQKK